MKFHERWFHRLSRASVHVFIILFGILGLTPYQVGSVGSAGVFGIVESIALIIMGTLGAISACADRTLSEVIALRGESVLFLILAAAAVVVLSQTEFTQWQGVALYLAMAASLGARSLSLARALSLVVEVRRG